MADSDPPHHEHESGDDRLLCPLCLLVNAAADMRPEVRDHLRAAGRELALAMRAALGGVTAAEGDSSPSERLRRIDLDET